MSDYTKSTNFATKDNLSSGNPLKIVKGTEIDTEFNNIQTAIATKADLVSPPFTGTPTLPTGTIAVTQSSGNSTTAIATTAFVQAALQLLYPVGVIYSTTVSTNPNTIFGFGTWTAFGAGQVMIGNGGGFSAGDTGGSADSIVVSHTHTATVTDPTHVHGSPNGTSFLTAGGGTGGTIGGSGVSASGANTAAASTGISVSISTTGVSGTNANLPPYIVVYMWQRTA